MPFPDVESRTRVFGRVGQILVRVGVWLLEMLTLSVGTCLIMAVLWMVQEAYSGHVNPFRRSDMPILLGAALVILFYFGITGYLATTLIFRFVLRRKGIRFYPYVCAGLYFVHSTIFFVGVGNSIFRRDDLIIQFCGSGVALLCAWSGNKLLSRWIAERSGPSRPLVDELEADLRPD